MVWGARQHRIWKSSRPTRIDTHLLAAPVPHADMLVLGRGGHPGLHRVQLHLPDLFGRGQEGPHVHGHFASDQSKLQEDSEDLKDVDSWFRENVQPEFRSPIIGKDARASIVEHNYANMNTDCARTCHGRHISLL